MLQLKKGLFYASKDFGYFRAGRISPNKILATIYLSDGETTKVIVMSNYDEKNFIEVPKKEFIANCTERYLFKYYETWKARLPDYLFED